MKRFNHYIFSFLLLCVSFPVASQVSDAYFWKKLQPDFDHQMEQLEIWSRQEADSLFPIRALEEMKRLAQYHNKPQMWARYRYWETYKDKKLSADSMLVLLKKALILSDQSDYSYDCSRISMRMAVCLSKLMRFADAYRLYQDALNGFNQAGDFRLKACVLNNIGNIFFFLNEYDEAAASFVEADSIFSLLHLTQERLECKMLLANIYLRTDRKQEASVLLRPIIDNYKSGDYPPDMRIAVLLNYLSCLEKKDDALVYADEAYSLAKKLDDPYYLFISILNKGWAELYMGRINSAAYFVAKADSCAATWHDVSQIKAGVYKLYTALYEEKQQWDSAFYYQKRYYACVDSVREKGALTDIHQLEIKKEIDGHRIQAELEKQKSRQKLLFVLLIGGVSLVLFLFSLYVIWLLRKKMQREQLLRQEKDREYILQLSKEKELTELKNRELSSNAVLIMKKNAVLKQILEDMESVKGNDVSAEREWERKIQSELQFDNTWETFKLHFDQVHPSFFQLLKERYPKLTDNDLRLCAYIRTGLNNKQIAEMLLVQSKTILQARYRLKKKMQLPDEVHLNDYLKSISRAELQ